MANELHCTTTRSTRSTALLTTHVLSTLIDESVGQLTVASTWLDRRCNLAYKMTIVNQQMDSKHFGEVAQNGYFVPPVLMSSLCDICIHPTRLAAIPSVFEWYISQP